MQHSGPLHYRVAPPPPVIPGAKVGVAALSGPVSSSALQRGLDELRRLGFSPYLAQNVSSSTGLFAGSDEERVDAFHSLVAAEEIEAIFFARGGHGLLRALPRLDWQLIAQRPRAFVGYSDVTPLLNELVLRLGWAAYHGPMVASDMARGLSAAEERSLLDCLAGNLPQSVSFTEVSAPESFEGPLLGGCLSMLAAACGTPYGLQTRNAVLFWEDVAEPLYRLDRMLIQLQLSGSLRQPAGVLVGRLQPASGESKEELHRNLEDLLARDYPWPTLMNIPSGHDEPNLTLPLGLGVRFDAAQKRLQVGIDLREESFRHES